MGYAWLIAPALALIPAALIWLERNQRGDIEDYGCPQCGHDTGLDRDHCAEVEQVGGWTEDVCECRNDFHQAPRHFV